MISPEDVGGGAALALIRSEFVKGLRGPQEAGKWVRAQVARLFTSPNAISVVGLAQQMLRDIGEPPHEVAPKRLLSIIEGASVEDDAELQERWAALLANDSRSGNSSRRNYALIVRELTALDARVLEEVAGPPHPKLISVSVHEANRHITRGYRAGLMHAMMGMAKVHSSDVDVSLDNLVRLGLISVSSEMRDPTGHPAPEGMIPCDVLSLTMLGLHFVDAIRPPRRVTP